MGWGYGEVDGREVGYNVMATCDFPGCKAKIDRGLGYCCGTMHGGDNGCGNYFCAAHLFGIHHNCPYDPKDDEDEDEECPSGTEPAPN